MSDLTTQEEAHVRGALHFLRLRFGGWASLAKVLRFNEITLKHVANGKTVSASMAVRVAKLVNVGVDDLLAGKFPSPGTCPYCGHQKEATVDPLMGIGRPPP